MPFTYTIPAALLFFALASPAAAAPADMLHAAGPAMFAASGATGMVVVVVTPAGIAIHGYGQDAPASGKAPGPDSLVRIASTSKLLTADVALKLAAEGALKLEHDLQRYAPPGVVVPVFAGARPITLLDLATHTSGLPRQAEVAYPKESAPWAWPSAPVRWTWLAAHKPAGAPGLAALYSNVGFDVLADALAQAGGKPYPVLLREKITGPLGMADTTPTPSAQQCARLLQGLDSTGPCADTSATAGTGGVYSTPADMGTWMAYALGLNRQHKQNPRALKMVLKRDALTSLEVLDVGGPVHGLGLGWIHSGGSPALVQKTGGGVGFMSYMALAPSAQVGVFAVMTRVDQPALRELVKRVTALTGELAARQK